MDATDSYAVTFYFGGAMFLCAGCVYYLLPCVKYLQATPTDRTAA